jgi:hypothetical protein
MKQKENIVTILSLGAGVQSSTLALMAARGIVTPMPTAAIFADTQAEPAAVMKWLDWLETQLPFPIIRVTRGNLMADSLKTPTSRNTGLKYIKGLIPAYVLSHNGTKGLLGRKCTADYKVDIIVKQARKLCGWKRGEKRHLVDMWIGISRDEAIRMKPSRHAFIENTWPLIDLGMTRRDCLEWMSANGYPEPPRSACTFCPFHSDEEWSRIKTQTPEEWDSVVEYERKLISAAKSQQALKGTPYLHQSCKPIDTVDFVANIPTHHQVSMFGNECEGLCGV